MTDIEEDEGYLSRLLLLHPEIDPGADDLGVVGEPAPFRASETSVRVGVAVDAGVGVGRHAGPVIAYDGDGWISVVPDEPPAPEPEAEPAPTPTAPAVTATQPPPVLPPPATATTAPKWWRRNAAYLAVVLIVAIVVAGMALAPGGDRPVLLTGSPTTTKPPVKDPLSQEWRLEKINLQFNEVEEGYVQVFDGAIDPVGTDGCTQPKRADGVVAASKTAYAYRPDNLDGFAAGHVAAMVTVFRDAATAKRRAEAESQPDYMHCLTKWDEATWFGDTTLKPTVQKMTVIPVALAGRTVVGGRYTATYKADDGGTYTAYTDNIIVTTGRVRVWVELSSVLYPFDSVRREEILHNILDRVDKALD